MKFHCCRGVAALALLLGLQTFVSSARAQPVEANYDENLVPEYELPDPLMMEDGTPVTNAEQWVAQRRPELLELFAEQVYGRAPSADALPISWEVTNTDQHALEDTAIRKEVEVRFGEGDETVTMTILLHVPKTGRPVPAFLGLNFGGNHTIDDDPDITLNTNWMRNDPDDGFVDNAATEATRGVATSQWQVRKIVERGYALATVYYGDIDPDFDDGFANGIHALTRDPGAEIAPDDGGSIAAWAWGLSRALDYLEHDPDIDATRVAVIGHSRLGKTALWAGATDERFALVISNNSGCGGAALSRRVFGETVERINTSFPHWFCDNYQQYNSNEAACPVDQHELIALIAPRPVYVASAAEDLWADPNGEFLSCLHADPVYRLLGTDGLGAEVSDAPAVDEPINSGTIGYHNRSGEHDVTAYDWDQYLDFADRHLR